MKSLRLAVLAGLILLLFMNITAFGGFVMVYHEDFNSGASLSGLGFTGPEPTFWTLDTTGSFMKSITPGGEARISSGRFFIDRDKGSVTTEWKVNFLSDRPGQAWMENNQLRVSLEDANGNLRYTLLFKPHAKQDQWREPDLELSSGSNTFGYGWTKTTTPTLTWLSFRIILKPRTITGGDGKIKVYCDLGDGRGYIEYISVTDESSYQFSRLNFSYHTGTHGQNFSVGIDDLSVTMEDLVPPVTRHDFSGGDKWIQAPVEVDLTSEDDRSGVARTYYRIDSGATMMGNLLTFTDDGEYQVEFWAVDRAGNIEATQTLLVKLDQTKPVITAEFIPSPNEAGWCKANVAVEFKATDACSGLASVSEPVVIDTEGQGRQIKGEAVDRAGNVAVIEVAVSLDKTAPIVANVYPPDGYWTNNSKPSISASLIEELSGIDPASLFLQIDGQNYAESATITQNSLSITPTTALAPGYHRVSLQIRDRAGNVSPLSATAFTIDPAMPTLPPDPATVAPRLDGTIVTDLGSATAFLYTGENPIQTGVAQGAIEPVRAAALRGRVLCRDGKSLPGVNISILGHPEFGQTITRQDG